MPVEGGRATRWSLIGAARPLRASARGTATSLWGEGTPPGGDRTLLGPRGPARVAARRCFAGRVLLRARLAGTDLEQGGGSGGRRPRAAWPSRVGALHRDVSVWGGKRGGGARGGRATSTCGGEGAQGGRAKPGPRRLARAAATTAATTKAEAATTAATIAEVEAAMMAAKTAADVATTAETEWRQRPQRQPQ